ncbi:LacI family transcriptional regulator [Labedella gwakjiensis]|uniref:LacI family transcriptional regulator n=1 Tax=Labedella gwakjiensis TaxID=390269 RepID=A0A2P8H058_9MICO|nr:LacI family DNA-binding transcriptional regulator [Labedella gwakjiensis]PSL39578.1 LacI family transcriptional regulator [Labedella gwakjiensis]RUQ86026.1 LacI family transcriptional regulator [Labedella gwakjiensis]
MVGPESTAPRATMRSIAERAETSVPTVSKVLNGGTDVSEATRRRVIDAAHELGYRRRPRTTGNPRRPRESELVDVVVGHVGSSWISRVLEGIEEECAAAGTDLVLSVARADGKWLRRITGRPSIGAILVVTEADAAELYSLTSSGVPVVAIDPGSRPPADIASVGSTNWDGGRMAAEHLLDRGHRSFGIVAGRRSHPFSNARVDGFLTAARGADATVPAERQAFCDWDREMARLAAIDMLSPAERPTAVFACSDVMALGVYDAAASLGLAIPDDLSVVGFDDVEESALAAPPLTTVQQPISEMGATAFRMLHQAATRGRSASDVSQRLELETRLVERHSTARPPLGPRQP